MVRPRALEHDVARGDDHDEAVLGIEAADVAVVGGSGEAGDAGALEVIGTPPVTARAWTVAALRAGAKAIRRSPVMTFCHGLVTPPARTIPHSRRRRLWHA